MEIIIVGSGIFGVTAAIELSRRRHAVTLADPGPVPHPLAASTDISKAIRLEYGSDELYVGLMERCLPRWRAWNREWGEELFHETGIVFLRRGPLEPGCFEAESLRLLQARGHAVQSLSQAEIAARFPAWNADRFSAGIFDDQGGYADSARVVARLAAVAEAAGIRVVRGSFAGFQERGSRVTAVRLADGSMLRGDRVVVAAGAWTPHLLPELQPYFRTNGMPVFHLKPADPGLFAPARFPVFCADITATGYYGFPANPEGIVKVANHGPGREMHPESKDREVTAQEILDLRSFLTETFPALVEAPLVYTRVCLYCDTFDGDFWIDSHPDRPGLVVATGGSGHAFKFAPLLGEWIANAVEEAPDPATNRFRWRQPGPNRRREAARKKSSS